MVPAWKRQSKVRPVRFIIVSILATLTLWVVISRTRAKPPLPPVLTEEPKVNLPTYEIWGIQELDAHIKVSTIQIQTQPDKEYRTPLKQAVDFNFDFTDVDLTLPLPDLPTTQTTIKVADTGRADGSEIIFGMGTKLDRLRDVLPSVSHWASGTNTHIVALIQPESPDIPTKAEIMEMYDRQDIKLTLIESELDWPSQFVALAGIIYDHAVPGTTKWACIMDDDTYFFSMRRVLKMLDKYNANRAYYIGGLSENKESWDRMGYFAYGGAGTFLSLPLLAKLRPRIDDCILIPEEGGDVRLNTCIMNFTTTKFTWDHKLFQVDLHGDVTGFYEAPRERPVSTHHWKSWHHHDMAQVGAVSRACGSECVLQKYTTSDHWMITNGFSVIKHSYTKEERDQHIPGAMEHTWDTTAWDIPSSWKYTLYPLKPKDPDKKQYIVEKADETEMDVTQYYVRRKDGRGTGIIRLIWKK